MDKKLIDKILREREIRLSGFPDDFDIESLPGDVELIFDEHFPELEELDPDRLNPEMLDYESDHYCPAYKKIISADLCYDSLCCLTGMFKISSTKELAEIPGIEEARKICKACPYSDLNGGMDEWDGKLD